MKISNKNIKSTMIQIMYFLFQTITQSVLPNRVLKLILKIFNKKIFWTHTGALI